MTAKTHVEMFAALGLTVTQHEAEELAKWVKAEHRIHDPNRNPNLLPHMARGASLG